MNIWLNKNASRLYEDYSPEPAKMRLMKIAWARYCQEHNFDPFYELMESYLLKHDRRCPKCNEPIWTAYDGGHVWEACLDCGDEAPCLQRLAEGQFDLAGYITTYDWLGVPLPKGIETRLMKHQTTEESHEGKYYRALRAEEKCQN